MRRCGACALVVRLGFAIGLIGAYGGSVAAQSSCLPPSVINSLNGVTDIQGAVNVLTEQLNSAGGTLSPSLKAALQSVTSQLGQTASQVPVVQGQVIGIVCDALEDVLELTGKVAAQAAAQSGVALVTTGGLASAIMGRLDASRGYGAGMASYGASPEGRWGLGAADKSRPAPPPGSIGPLTVYGGGTYLAGSSADTAGTPGFSYGGGSALLGLEYSANRNLILGVAGSFTAMDADIDNGGTVGAEVIHGAAYLSYATRAWFVDALAAYGALELDLTRPGADSALLRGSTSGDAVAAAARGGYLFDLGKVRAGPIAGLTYVRARIDGYTETGGSGALAVGEQTVESLTGSAGVRVLAPFQAGSTLFVPYLNVTLEHHFGDSTGQLTAGLSGGPPGAPLSVSFPVFDTRDYGKVEGGVTIELAPEASVSLSGASTFAREDGHDYRVSAGLNYRF